MAVTIEMLFYGAAILFFVLWFLDEIISIKNFKKYGRKGDLNPLIGWFLHHHAKRLIYLKLLIYDASAMIFMRINHLKIFIRVMDILILRKKLSTIVLEYHKV